MLHSNKYLILSLSYLDDDDTISNTRLTRGYIFIPHAKSPPPHKPMLSI